MPGPRKPEKPNRASQTKAKTDADWALFLAHLSKTANVTRSAEASNIDRATVYRKRKDDPEFAKQFEEAYQTGYLALEEECQRRAFEGFQEPVFYKGEKVATVTRFSDPLAMFLLKGNMAEKFKDRSEVTTGGPKEGRYTRLTDEELEAELKRRGM